MVKLLDKISESSALFLTSLGKMVIRSEPKIKYDKNMFIPKSVWEQLNDNQKLIVAQENNDLDLVGYGILIMFVVLFVIATIVNLI